VKVVQKKVDPKEEIQVKVGMKVQMKKVKVKKRKQPP
jgi:hypothetical protein